MAILPDKSRHEMRENDTKHPLGPSSEHKLSSDHQRKSTSRSSVGRAKSTRSFRHSLRSAVPDTSVITMAKRPDHGGTGKHYLKIFFVF